MWEYKEISFTNDDGLSFEMQLNTRITAVAGESAIGKSYFLNSLDTWLNELDYSLKPNPNIKITNRGSDIAADILNGHPPKDTIFFIDSADVVFFRHPELAEFVKKDISNYWVLFGRSNFNGLYINCYNTVMPIFDKDKNKIRFLSCGEIESE